MLVKITVAYVILLLAGCATHQQKRSDSVSNRDQGFTSVFVATDFLAVADIGDVVNIENTKYTVLDDYTAASGRRCKRLHAVFGDQVRVGCRSGTDEWYLRESLGGNVQQDSVVVPSPNFVDEIIDPDIKSVALRSNENLWRFSRRVTGSANNWQKIARYNDIDDVTSLEAGYHLKIPPELSASTDSD